MTDAREIIAREIEPQSWAALGAGDTLAYRNRRTSSDRKAIRIVQALTSAGIRFAGPDDRILGPDEVDAVTVEMCATEMEVNWGHVCTPELRDAILALKGGGT
jgi:hypothetical protein